MSVLKQRSCFLVLGTCWHLWKEFVTGSDQRLSLPAFYLWHQAGCIYLRKEPQKRNHNDLCYTLPICGCLVISLDGCFMQMIVFSSHCNIWSFCLVVIRNCKLGLFIISLPFSWADTSCVDICPMFYLLITLNVIYLANVKQEVLSTLATTVNNTVK